jgi:hypothetical protein
MKTNETVTALKRATAGLTYPSETDSRWTAFSWPDATGTPTADEICRRGHHKPGVRVQEIALDDLFAPLVQDQVWYGDGENAAAAKNRTLLDAIKGILTNTKVFRIGERRVAIYVVGLVKAGGWAGLKTMAVET